MNWFEVATFEPYLYYCSRSYEKVSSLFNKTTGQPLSPQDYEKQPRTYFRKLLLMGLNANSFEQQKTIEDAKAVAQIRQQNKSLKQKAKTLLSTVEDNQREIDLVKKKLRKSAKKHSQSYSLTCPICEKPIESKQSHLQHFKMHMHNEQPNKNKNSQLLQMLIEQQKLLLSQSSVALKKNDHVPGEKERHLDQLIKKSEELISVLGSCKEESMQRSIEISDHLLRLQRYQFDRRSSELQKNQSRLSFERAITPHAQQPRTEDKFCYFQPDSQGLIKLTQLAYPPQNFTRPRVQAHYGQAMIPQQQPRSRSGVSPQKNAILEQNEMILQYGTEQSSYTLSSHPSSIRIRCREEDFMFDESKVRLFACQPQPKMHQQSQSVDFTISNDSSSRVIRKHQNFKPSLIIEDESKLWSRSYK